MAAQKKLALTSNRTFADIRAGQKFCLHIGWAHRSPHIQRLAELRDCQSGIAYSWQCDLQGYCQDHAAWADGRLPFDDERVVTIAGPVEGMGSPADILRDALEAGVLRWRYGHLHLVGFKDRYPNAAAHSRARQIREQWQYPKKRKQGNVRQQDYARKRREDRAEQRANERFPAALPERPRGKVPSDAPNMCVSLASAPPPNRPNEHPAERVITSIIIRQKRDSAETLEPAPERQDERHLGDNIASGCPADALKRIAEARSSKSRRNSYSVPLKPLHLEKLVNPLPPSGDEGSRHVCMDSGAAERPADPPERPGSATDAPPGSEGSGQADPLGDAAGERPGEQASPAAGKRLEPALFAQVLQHLVKAGCGRPETQEAAEQMLGADYEVLAAHRRDGKAGMAALALESEVDRPAFVRALCSVQARAHARRQGEATEAARAAHAAAKACRRLRPPDPPPEPPQAAVAALRPPAEPDAQPPGRPRHCYRPPPHRGRRAPRVRGQPAGPLPAGACTLAELRRLVAAEPDLPRIKVPMAKILALGLSPERVALAFREAKAGLRDPQALGWAALTRMLRITGDLPQLTPR